MKDMKYGMFSAEGNRLVGQMLNRVREDLAIAVRGIRAKHPEVRDTAVRERIMYEVEEAVRAAMGDR